MIIQKQLEEQSFTTAVPTLKVYQNLVEKSLQKIARIIIMSHAGFTLKTLTMFFSLAKGL